MEPEMLMNLAWYREEDWPRWLEISDDEMCATYSQWLKGAEKTLLEATRQGTVVHRTEIRPDEFLTWAKLKRIPLNGHARIEFAGERFGFVKRVWFTSVSADSWSISNSSFARLRPAASTTACPFAAVAAAALPTAPAGL